MTDTWMKLSSGEDMIGQIKGHIDGVYDEATVAVYSPMTIKYMRIPTSKGAMDSYMLTPWSTLTNEEVVHVCSKHIMMATPAGARISALYHSYLQEQYEEVHVGASQEDPISDDLQTIQDLFDELGGVDDDNDEEQEDRTRSSPRKHYH